MSFATEQMGKMISSASIGAVAYQASSLISELRRINKEEYLEQACQIRDVFLCIAEYIEQQLWELKAVSSGVSVVPESVATRTRELGYLLHELYSYIRYLWASSPRQTPPGIQVALAQLTETYFPAVNGAPLCLVRPQWKYNLTYVPITWYLRQLLRIGVLDPNGKFGAKNADELLQKLWAAWRENHDQAGSGIPQVPPTQLAILSFAGLDTEDTLLYPLLAHELGHFIDYSHQKPLYLSDELKAKAGIKLEQVREVMEKTLGKDPEPQDVDANLKFLVNQVSTALREILADLFATRMLGFGFFAAQSEFLKTLAAWPEAPITSSGYPGIKAP
jgi:hypothetical protein